MSPVAWTIWTFHQNTQDVDANLIKQYKICTGCSSVQITSGKMTQIAGRKSYARRQEKVLDHAT